jgi:hypothetical protein
MRLLMISDADAPWTPHFARFLTARGDDLLVVSFAPGALDGVDGVPLEFVGTETRPRREITHRFFTRIPRISRIIRRFSPDLVLAPCLASNGLVAALSWRGPTAVAAVGGDVLNRAGGFGDWKLLLRKAILRFVCRRAALVNAVSQPLAEERVRLGVPASRILRLPFGVDLEVAIESCRVRQKALLRREVSSAGFFGPCGWELPPAPPGAWSDPPASATAATPPFAVRFRLRGVASG